MCTSAIVHALDRSVIYQIASSYYIALACNVVSGFCAAHDKADIYRSMRALICRQSSARAYCIFMSRGAILVLAGANSAWAPAYFNPWCTTTKSDKRATST